MKKYSKKQIIEFCRRNLLVVLGTAVLAFGSAIFLVPCDLVVGGTSGIIVVLKSLFSADKFDPNVAVMVITWGLFLVGLILLGRDFAMKTLVSTVVYPIAFALFSLLADPEVLGGYFHIQSSPYTEISLVFAGVVGGGLLGVGSALAFLGGGTTGGTDIISFLVCKFFPKLRISKVTFAVDSIIILLGIFAVNDMVISGIGIFSAYVSSLFIDKIFVGGSTAYVAHIVTTAPEQISRDVIEILDRTTTIMDCKGAYTGEAKNIVMVSFTTREYREILSIVSKYDKKAFITVNQAHEISGEGW